MKVEVKGNNEEVKLKKYEGEGIIVGEACSTEKQIRFYLNETTFVSATKEQNSNNEEIIVVDLADNEEKYVRRIMFEDMKNKNKEERKKDGKKSNYRSASTWISIDKLFWHKRTIKFSTKINFSYIFNISIFFDNNRNI